MFKKNGTKVIDVKSASFAEVIVNTLCQIFVYIENYIRVRGSTRFILNI